MNAQHALPRIDPFCGKVLSSCCVVRGARSADHSTGAGVQVAQDYMI